MTNQKHKLEKGHCQNEKIFLKKRKKGREILCGSEGEGYPPERGTRRKFLGRSRAQAWERKSGRPLRDALCEPDSP